MLHCWYDQLAAVQLSCSWSAKERHTSFLCVDLVEIVRHALSEERGRAAPFSQERVDFTLAEERVGPPLAKEWIPALVLEDVVEQLGVVEWADTAFGDRLGLSGGCGVQLISTGWVGLDVAAAAGDVDMRVAGWTAAARRAHRRHPAARTCVHLDDVMRGWRVPGCSYGWRQQTHGAEWQPQRRSRSAFHRRHLQQLSCYTMKIIFIQKHNKVDCAQWAETVAKPSKLNQNCVCIRAVFISLAIGKRAFTLCLKKVNHLMFDNNFGKICGPIFKILSPVDS